MRIHLNNTAYGRVVIVFGVLGMIAAAGLSRLFICGLSVPLIPQGGFHWVGLDSTARNRFVHVPRWSSVSAPSKISGTLTSQSFLAPSHLALRLAGFPNHRDESLALVTTAVPRVYVRLDFGNDPGRRWSERVIALEPSLIGRRVVFIATDSSRSAEDWLGIADLHSVSYAQAFLDTYITPIGFDLTSPLDAADQQALLLFYVLLAMLLPFPFIVPASTICRRIGLPPIFFFSIVLILMGITAEATFFFTMIDTNATAAVAMAAYIVGSAATGVALRDRQFRKIVWCDDARLPFIITAVCGLTYVALLSIVMPETGSVPASVIHWLAMPDDNILPHHLASNIASHAPPKPFHGSWLSSDRPPLEAGFDLLFAALFPLTNDDGTQYQAISMILQATIAGALFTLCRAWGLANLRSAAIIALTWTSGFFFMNTIFIWPKLIAAAYVAIAMAIFVFAGARRLAHAALIGSAVALGLLSHTGVVFTVPALIVSWLMVGRAKAIRPLVFAALVLLIQSAPWSWYQHFYDPPADRLLKWHLAGQTDVTNKSFPATLIDAYTKIPVSQLIQNRLVNFDMIVGAFPSGELRDRQFFSVRYALGALIVPWIAALFLVRSKRPGLALAARLAWISLGSTLFWALIMFGPGYTLIHAGSYLTLALMFVAGSSVVAEWPLCLAVYLFAQALLFFVAWQSKFESGVPMNVGRFCDVGVLLVIALLIAVPSTRWASATLRSRSQGNGLRLITAPLLLSVGAFFIVVLTMKT